MSWLSRKRISVKPKLQLRPQSLAEFGGQARVTMNLQTWVASVLARGKHLDHTLLAGSAGLGKTSLAHIVANELGTFCTEIPAPLIGDVKTLAATLAKTRRHSVLFIDEVHGLKPKVAEALYTVLEDFRLAHLRYAPFTVVGATTEPGTLAKPLRDRFGIKETLTAYAPLDLARIVLRAAQAIEATIDTQAATELAARARGTPRVALNYLKRARDVALAHAPSNPAVTLHYARVMFDMLEVDPRGLTRDDRLILAALSDKPVGLDTLASITGLDRATIAKAHEPYLLRQGLVVKTPKGRVKGPNA